VGLDGCEVRLRGPCAFVRPRVPCVSRVCPGSPGVTGNWYMRESSEAATMREKWYVSMNST